MSQSPFVITLYLAIYKIIFPLMYQVSVKKVRNDQLLKDIHLA